MYYVYGKDLKSKFICLTLFICFGFKCCSFRKISDFKFSELEKTKNWKTGKYYPAGYGRLLHFKKFFKLFHGIQIFLKTRKITILLVMIACYNLAKFSVFQGFQRNQKNYYAPNSVRLFLLSTFSDTSSYPTGPKEFKTMKSKHI